MQGLNTIGSIPVVASPGRVTQYSGLSYDSATGIFSVPVMGNNAAKYREATSTTSVTSTDSVINCTSGTFAVTLLSAVSVSGKKFTIKNTGSGVITINTTSSQTIDADASGDITLVQWESLDVFSNGSNWVVV